MEENTYPLTLEEVERIREWLDSILYNSRASNYQVLAEGLVYKLYLYLGDVEEQLQG